MIKGCFECLGDYFSGLDVATNAPFGCYCYHCGVCEIFVGGDSCGWGGLGLGGLVVVIYFNYKVVDERDYVELGVD